MKKKQHDLLIDDDELLIVQTKLAVLIGDRPAIALQQIHYWLELNKKAKKGDTHYFDGKWWAYNTWAEWLEENFSFWSKNTLIRVFASLEENELITLRDHQDKNKGKWVTINYDKLDAMYGSTQNGYTPDSGENPDENLGGLPKMGTPSTQNGYPTSNTETNTENLNTIPLQNLTGEIANIGARSESSVANAPSFPSATAETGDFSFFTLDEGEDSLYTNEESLEIKKQDSALVRYLTDNVRRTKRMGKTVKAACARKVSTVSISAGNVERESPDTLFDTDHIFRKYVEDKVRYFNTEFPGGEYSHLVNLIRDYGNAKFGWITYSASQMSSDFITEYSGG